jgi:hypothetical protein
VQVGSDSLGEHGEEVGLGWLKTHVLHDWFHGGEDLFLIIKAVQVGNVTRVQDVVDIFQEGFALDLNES